MRTFLRSLLLKDLSFVLFLLAITAAGVVSCGGPKQFPHSADVLYFPSGPLRSARVF